MADILVEFHEHCSVGNERNARRSHARRTRVGISSDLIRARPGRLRMNPTALRRVDIRV